MSAVDKADWRPCPDCGAPQVRTTVTGIYVHVHSLRQVCDRPRKEAPDA